MPSKKLRMSIRKSEMIRIEKMPKKKQNKKTMTEKGKSARQNNDEETLIKKSRMPSKK